MTMRSFGRPVAQVIALVAVLSLGVTPARGQPFVAKPLTPEFAPALRVPSPRGARSQRARESDPAQQFAVWNVNSDSDGSTTNPFEAEDVSPGNGQCRDALGRCTLRAAIMEANAWPEPGMIYFVITGQTYITVTLTRSLPTVTSLIQIIGSDGMSQGRVSITSMKTPYLPLSGAALQVSSSGELRVQDLTIADVVSLGDGGAIRSEGRLEVRSSALVRNSAVRGGGVFVAGGTATITNTTFSANNAVPKHLGELGGGAIYGAGGATDVSGSTFYGNFAYKGTGDTFATNGGTIVLLGSIVAKASTAGHCATPITSNGYNLTDEGTCGLADATDQQLAQIDLGPLANNDSKTPTHAVLAGNPAIDAIPAGICSAWWGDQRWVKRPQGAGCDIGAYELMHWTFMLYLDGDTASQGNLTSAVAGALASLEATRPNPYVRVAVLADGDGTLSGSYVPTGDTYRRIIQYQDNYVNGVNWWYEGERNMGQPSTLDSLISWAHERLPAQHFYVAIADHGRGTAGIAYDTTSGMDRLTPAELKAALQLATQNGQWKIDVLHYDACLMALFEQAYLAKDYARYLVASANLMWMVMAYSRYVEPVAGVGIATEAVMSSLLTNVTAATEPEQLARMVADTYFSHPTLVNAGLPRTIAVLDLSRAAAVRGAIDDLASAMRSQMSGAANCIRNARGAAQKYDSRTPYYVIDFTDEYVDLYNFAQILASYSCQYPIPLKAYALMNELSSGFVLQESHMSGSYNGAYMDLFYSRGLAIYFPLTTSSWDYGSYKDGSLFQFTADSVWDEFLNDYYVATGGVVPGPPVDPGLPPAINPFFVYAPAVAR